MDLAVAFSGFTAAVTLRRARSDSAKRALARWRHPVLLGALQAWVGAVDCVKWEAAEAQRAKEQLEALAAAREGSPKAMKQAVKMVEHSDAKVALAAMKLVLEYGLGKPTQVVDVTQRTEQDVPTQPEERAALARKFEEAAAELRQEQEGMH